MINDVRINTTAPVCIRLSAMHISKVCDHVKCVIVREKSSKNEMNPSKK